MFPNSFQESSARGRIGGEKITPRQQPIERANRGRINVIKLMLTPGKHVMISDLGVRVDAVVACIQADEAMRCHFARCAASIAPKAAPSKVSEEMR